MFSSVIESFAQKPEGLWPGIRDDSRAMSLGAQPIAEIAELVEIRLPLVRAQAFDDDQLSLVPAGELTDSS